MIAQKLCDRHGVIVIDQERLLSGRPGIRDDVDFRTARGQLRPVLDLFQRFHVSDAFQFRRMISIRIGGRLQIVFAKGRHRKFARLFRFQEVRFRFAA